MCVTGPEPLSAREAVQIPERVVGRPFKVQGIPIAVLRVARFLVMPFNEVLASELGMGLDMQQGERTDLGLRLTEFGVQPTTFEQYVRQACAASTRH